MSGILLRSMLWLAAIAAILLPDMSVQAQERPRPNVLLIVVDDLNTSLGCYGHPIVKSPNIDRLATSGVRFERAYCQGTWCVPSRASFLTGRRVESLQAGEARLLQLGGMESFPQHFRKHGYFTAKAGKIAHRDRVEGLWSVLESWDGPDDQTAQRVVKLLEAKRDQPFLIAAGFHKPHVPLKAPQSYYEMYPPDKVPLPTKSALPGVYGKPTPAAPTRDILKVIQSNLGTAQFLAASDEQQRAIIAAYYACVSFMDAQVGVLLDALDRLKLRENTIVLLFSDHGFHLGEHGGLFQKKTLFERDARVPLIVSAPGKRQGVASSRLVELVDVFPTLTELCGLPAPEGLEGTSVVPLLHTPDRPWKMAAFTFEGRYSVRSERYRYTLGKADKTGQNAELYDHQTDPEELTNLPQDPKHAQVMAEMRKLLADGWKSTLPPRAPEKP
jgi:iduronate 2-sulfatase